MDIFELCKKSYLVLTDYYSKYLEILPLKNKTASEIINNLKNVFASHGIPKTIVADNVPFGSFEFRKFCNRFDIEIITTSPHYPQANGLAEKSVQIAKNLIQKSRESNEELWLTLLEYRNTPIKNSNKSPAEILMGRKQRTLIPARSELFRGKNPEFTKVVSQNNLRNERYYNRTTKSKQSFSPNQDVWLKEDKHWKKGKIMAKHNTPRSYLVQKENGTVVRRNSSVLRSRST